jgi:asparagine synthase (glutamine-hydrolysing)
MLNAAPHRGDRHRLHLHGDCLLAISENPDRPDSSLVVDDGLAAAFVGVLDNSPQLARELALPATVNGPASPADVLLAGFRAYGDELPARLRGVFAGAVSDGRSVFSFRDQLGFGPLHFREDRTGCYIATEPKQVLAGAGVAREPDVEALQAIYYHRDEEGSSCALRGVRRLPKTTALTAGPERVRIRRYWDPAQLLETARLTPDELAQRFDELMTLAAGRMVTGSDAVSLSGGIDSPAIAAFAAPEHLRVSGRPLGAVSMVYPQFPAVDERRYVELVAHDLDLPLHFFEQQAAPMDRLREWTELMDGPVPSVAMAQYEELYRYARDLGYRTVLTGEIAEFVMDMSSYLLAHLLTHRRFDALRAQLLLRRARGSSAVGLARQLGAPFVPTRLTAWRWRRARTAVPDWIDPRNANQAAVASMVPAGDRWTKVQLSAFDGSSVAIVADDLCQELCGVRTRRPWADVDLWEFFLSLPAELKHPGAGSKALVRKLLRGKIPDPILDRTDKTYFDDSVRARIDYPALRRWFADPTWRIEGVDYVMLRERLDREQFDLVDFLWAKDLASIHAFLSLW